MPRVKRGVTKNRRHAKYLELAKGHWGARHRLYKRARESALHALNYAYAHRRERKGDMRRLWILRIGAAARKEGISYSRLIHGLQLAEVKVDRKIMADLAVRDPQAFSRLASLAKEKAQATPASA